MAKCSSRTGWFICLCRDGADWEIAICERGHSAVPAAVSAALESTNVFGFVVDDVDKIAQSLIEGGAELESEIVDEAWGQRHFFVRDPEGTWLDVIQLTTPDPEWLANLPT
jgi:uncharacterized glyoxalase superfamily protein PhnB